MASSEAVCTVAKVARDGTNALTNQEVTDFG